MKRPIVWASIFTICGIYLRLGVSEVICLASVIFILLSVSQLVKWYKSKKYLFLLLFSVWGFLTAGLSAEREMAEDYCAERVYGNGVIETAAVTAAGNQKFYIYCDLWDDNGNSLQNVNLYVIWTGEEIYSSGDRVTFSGELQTFSEASVPGGYDENLYLRTRGFDGKIFAETMSYEGKDHSVKSLMARGRAHVHTTLEHILPANECGIMKAMLTGEKDDIPDESYQLYMKAGVVHILCISGLHMSILALYVSVFMEKILRQSRRVSAFVTMLSAVGFLIFTGFTPSAVRAVVMICVVMTGRILFRVHDRLNEIAIAAMLILAIEPLYLFHIGFQLSFITVLGLCIAAEKTERKKGTVLDLLKESLRYSVYASLFSFPLVAYHFYSVSLIGILANLIVIPLSGMLLGFGILSAVLGSVWLPLGVFAAGSVYAILQLFEITCTLLLQLPYAYLLTGRPSDWVMLLSYVLLFYWIWFSEKEGSWKTAVILCALLWIAVFENQLLRKETTVAFLDVGQGDAAVITTYDRKCYIVDGGGEFGREFGENVGETVLLPYLEYQGIHQVDAAFLSHPDADHMTGLLEILGKTTIKAFIIANYPYKVTENVDFLKEMVEKYPVALYTVDNTTEVSETGWTCLYPMRGISFSDDEENHGSMVLKYFCNGTEILFTGDIEKEDEALLLKRNADVSADILKVSHHGSAYSSDETFLAKTGASTAVISCGENNIYGHPHKETIKRLQTENLQILRTDESGTVFVRIGQDGSFKIETIAERKPLYERIKETMEKW